MIVVARIFKGMARKETNIFSGIRNFLYGMHLDPNTCIVDDVGYLWPDAEC